MTKELEYSCVQVASHGTYALSDDGYAFTSTLSLWMNTVRQIDAGRKL